MWTSNHKLQGGDRIRHPQLLLSQPSVSYLPPTRGLGFRRCWRLNRGGAYTDTMRHAMQHECQCMPIEVDSWNGVTWPPALPLVGASAKGPRSLMKLQTVAKLLMPHHSGSSPESSTSTLPFAACLPRETCKDISPDSTVSFALYFATSPYESLSVPASPYQTGKAARQARSC